MPSRSNLELTRGGRVRPFLGLGIHLHGASGLAASSIRSDRFGREEPVGDVAVGKLCRGRRWQSPMIPHAVRTSYFSFRPRRMGIVSSTSGSENETGGNAAPAPHPSPIMLRYSASVVAPDAMQLAAASDGLSRLEGVHRASPAPAADQRVHLVDEEDHLASAAVISRARLSARSLETRRGYFAPADQRAHVEAISRLPFRLSGTSPGDDAQAPSLRRVAVLPDDPGSADQTTGITFLGARERNLDRAGDNLLRRADDRIKALPCGAEFGEGSPGAFF